MINDLSGYLRFIAEKHRVPAVSIAIWRDHKLHRAAFGVLNVETGVGATVDSIFQVGSISKVFTASLIMLLVESGTLDLDLPVREYLPTFHVADRNATSEITLRHLLSHTSGLISDLNIGSAPEGASDLIAHYVDQCFLLPQAHTEIGKRFSYSNAAYVIAGRIIEVLTRTTWAEAVERYILRPLEMTETAIRPAETLRFRAAMGHLIGNKGESGPRVKLASTCYLPQGLAPAGAALAMTPSDLVKFGRAHLESGCTGSGRRWMAESSVSAMQRAQISLPAATLLSEDKWGIGWALTSGWKMNVFGHGGGTIGQQSLLEIFPDQEVVLAVQINGMTFGGAPVLQEVLRDILYDLTGVRPEQPQHRFGGHGPISRFTGRFGTVGWRFKIEEQDGALRAEMESDAGSNLPLEVFHLIQIADSMFEARTPTGIRVDDFTFLDPNAAGIPQYLFSGYRLHARVSPQ